MSIKISSSKKVFIVLVIVLFSVFRLYIGLYEQTWFFLDAIHDDLLLMSYADISYHFTHWDIFSLTKTMSYPLFLYFVDISCLPYRFWLSVIWILGGLFLSYGVNKYVTSNRILLIFIYLFIIFLPIAFDSCGGARIYRNSILAPFAILYLASLFIFINKLLFEFKNKNSVILLGIIFGFLFTFNFYIKEDGILNLPIFLVSIVFVLFYKLFSESKRMNHDYNRYIKIIVICLIPLFIFGFSTIAYKEVNNYYFGVSEINTRTEGELGEFWQNLLRDMSIINFKVF